MLKEGLLSLSVSGSRQKSEIIETLRAAIISAGYTLYEEDGNRPWGGYFRLADSEADRFVEEFFPGLDPQDARLGIVDAPLSPKILFVAPGQRLSWQFHYRRAERWAFLTAGGYYCSLTDDMKESVEVAPGEVVQFAAEERHRLVGSASAWTLVAEIWQHTDPQELSTEEDITRIQDDYSR